MSQTTLHELIERQRHLMIGGKVMNHYLVGVYEEQRNEAKAEIGRISV